MIPAIKTSLPTSGSDRTDAGVFRCFDASRLLASQDSPHRLRAASHEPTLGPQGFDGLGLRSAEWRVAAAWTSTGPLLHECPVA